MNRKDVIERLEALSLGESKWREEAERRQRAYIIRRLSNGYLLGTIRGMAGCVTYAKTADELLDLLDDAAGALKATEGEGPTVTK